MKEENSVSNIVEKEQPEKARSNKENNPANFANDKSLAKRAAKLQKRGRSVKTLAWDRLGYSLTNKHTNNIATHLDDLWKQGKHDLYFERYIALLKYFKPTVQAHAIKQETDITIKVISNDDKLLDKIG